MKVEHPFAPGANWIIAVEHLVGAHNSCPLEQAEQHIIGISGQRARQEAIPGERIPDRIEESPEGYDVLIASCRKLLKRAPEGCLDLTTQMSTVMAVYDRHHVDHQQRYEPWNQLAIDEACDEFGERTGTLTLKQK